MKRFIIIVAILLSMAVFGILVPAEGGPKVLLIPREGDSKHKKLALTKEVGVMTKMLKKAGFEVVVATVKGKPIVAYPFPVTTLEPDLKLNDVNVADYIGFIMPCMAVGWTYPVAPEAVAIVKQAVDEGKPVAAQLGSVMILAEAGVLKGKRYAYFFDKLNPDSGHQVAHSPFLQRSKGHPEMNCIVYRFLLGNVLCQTSLSNEDGNAVQCCFLLESFDL